MVLKNPKFQFNYCNRDKKNQPYGILTYWIHSISFPIPPPFASFQQHSSSSSGYTLQYYWPRETIQYTEHRPIPPEVRIRANSFCGGCWTVCETSSELDMLIPISFPYSSFTSRDGGAEIYQKSQELGFLHHDLKATLSTQEGSMVTAIFILYWSPWGEEFCMKIYDKYSNFKVKQMWNFLSLNSS